MVSNNQNLEEIAVVILAAGQGKRMRSPLPKVLHKVAEQEIVLWSLRAALEISPSIISIVLSADDAGKLVKQKIEDFTSKNLNEATDKVGDKADDKAGFSNYKKQNGGCDTPHNARAVAGCTIQFAYQKERLGTGHAVQQAIDANRDFYKNFRGNIIVIYADTPFLSPVILRQISLTGGGVRVIGFNPKDKASYGRLLIKEESKNEGGNRGCSEGLNEGGSLQKIIESKDLTKEEGNNLELCNSGVMAFSSDLIEEVFQLKNNNNKGEFYLTDLVEIAYNKGKETSFITANPEEIIGINDQAELAFANKIAQKSLRTQMMQNGVCLPEPDSVYFAYDTEIAAGCVVYPNVYFGKSVKIAENVTILPSCMLAECNIASGCVIGPFARVRPQTDVKENVKIGNFVEVKKSKIDKNTKINHLAYIGDAVIGKNTNIGAGSITCNYDGTKKHKTKIEDNVFIGSNSCLVAPVTIGENSVVGAGTTILQNVPIGSKIVNKKKQDFI